jgi:hypothetical protein
MFKNDIKHDWSLICESTIVDETSKKISILNVLEEITIDIKNNNNAKSEFENLSKNNELLTLPFKFSYISMWHHHISNNTNVDLKLEFYDPNKNKLWHENPKIEFDHEKQRTRILLNFNSIKIGTEEGTYRFVLVLKDRIISETHLELKVIK